MGQEPFYPLRKERVKGCESSRDWMDEAELDSMERMPLKPFNEPEERIVRQGLGP
jgi:hypothetical protein